MESLSTTDGYLGRFKKIGERLVENLRRVNNTVLFSGTSLWPIQAYSLKTYEELHLRS